MIFSILLGLLLDNQFNALTANTTCKCEQLLSNGDCERKFGCLWSYASKTCSAFPNMVEQAYETYCQQFDKINCPLQKGCQFYDSQCTHFTGCSAFPKTTHSDCSAISNQCISNGVNCKEKSACTSYTVQSECLVDADDKYCYWDSSFCIYATECTQLPLSFGSDTECRQQFYFCTVNQNLIGCQESGDNCVDQASISQCFFNRIKTERCFWNGTQCVSRNFCSNINVEKECTSNNNGGQCYWSSNNCVDKTCEAAPSYFITNDQCDQFIKGCITKKNGSCKQNGQCSVADIEEACKLSTDNKECFWNPSKGCVDKTCENAPDTYDIQELCESYITSCTVNEINKGCRVKSCDNAPQKYDTNQECNNFLTGCIAKSNGGCIINTTCMAIGTFEQACVEDSKGNPCVFYEKCKDKTCLNAPPANINHALCQMYLKSCTVNSTSNGCIDKLCENLKEQYACQFDKNSKPCIWKTSCYKKHCIHASKLISTYLECHDFMKSCTVDNSGYGCMDIPPQCKGILNEAGCFMNALGGKCVWFQNQCNDISCQTASNSLKSTFECNKYKQGCIINNTQNGCIKAANVRCSARTLQDNCFVGFGQTCLWDPTQEIKCIQISCETASQITIISSNGYISSPYPGFSNQSCDNYLQGCIINNNGDGCMIKANSCKFYKLQMNCQSGLINGNSCYWNQVDNSCVDIKCSLIKLSTHGDCQSVLNSCTYGDGIVCQTKLHSCNAYTQNQCFYTLEGNNCVWENEVCREATCDDADKIFQTHEACQRFSNSCTINSRISNTGCVQLSKSCSDYKEQAQCYLDSQGQDCIWNYQKCFLKSSLKCSNIVLSLYSTSECQAIISLCKSNQNFTACVDKDCVDYTSNCGNFGSDCLATVDGKYCFVKPKNCQGLDQNHCVLANDGQCVFTNPNCSVKPLVCDDLKGVNLSFSNCQNYSLLCSVNLQGTACISKKTICSDYSIQNNCRKSDAGFCKWNSTIPSGCINASTPAICSEIIAQSGLTFEICQDFDQSCSINLTGTSCITKNFCANYSQANCYKGSDAMCVWTGISCTPIITAADCPLIIGTNLTDTKCQVYNQNCITNQQGTACFEYKQTCSSFISSANCVKSKQGKCYWYSNACIQITVSSDCAKIQQGGLTNQVCESYSSLCTLNDQNTGCKAKSCQNKPSTGGYSDSACSVYLSNCTSNSISNSSGCISIPELCSLFKTQDACIRAAEGNCYWTPGIVANTGNCVKKSCSTAPINADFNTHTKCNNYSNSCTVAKSGGCSKIGTCNSYTTQFQCQEVGYCFWNARLNYGCVNKSCDQVETAYNTHALCLGTGLGCTVKTNSLGCQQLQGCQEYKTEEQCKINQFDKTCLWVDNGTHWLCLQKTCSTADYHLDTHEKCFNFLKSENNLIKDMCTVQYYIVNDSMQPGGCQQLTMCLFYQYPLSCVIDNEGNECIWNETSKRCSSKSCLTAPKTDQYDTDEECRQYIQNGNCTLDISGIGCTFKPVYCQGMTQPQCTFNYAGDPCEWFQGKCVNKTCETAPIYVTTAEGCNIYMEGCTMNQTNKCHNSGCENFQFTTDYDCKQAMPECTSNGYYCVTRTVCSAAFQAGCITQFDGKQCQWNSKTSICEVQEAKFLIKSSCTSIIKQSECSMESNSVICTWENDRCRNIDCQNLSGSTHKECYHLNEKCTIGENGKCTDLKDCSAYLLRAFCIFGLNGPCLWVSQFNKGQGACFLYQSCKSFLWKNDRQCKWISHQCTTNGEYCVAITSCAQTNTSGGCVTGYDGNCMQTVSQQGSTEIICKPFISCTDAPYLTHNDCQKLSPKCTTNGSTSCISLGSCSSYLVQESCKINVTGPLYDNGQVKSTGVCQWDTATFQCYEQTCSDLVGQNHQACFDQLSLCTSNGKNCVIKQTCQLYQSQQYCQDGIDQSDGKCIWDQYQKQCRAMSCSDINLGTLTKVCQSQMQSCISNGFQCLTQSSCASYKTQISCNQRGTDGICVFTASTKEGGATRSGTCQKMNSCQQANNDSNACSQAKDICLWDSATHTCAAHTCSSFYETNPNFGCKAFFKQDQNTQQFCQLVEGVCKEIDPITLSLESCNLISNYTYTWNQSTNKCEKCSKESNPINSNQTSPNETIAIFSSNLKYYLIVIGMIFNYF